MRASRSKRNDSVTVARIVRRVLQSDPEQEYFLYVPQTAVREAPVLVVVHGIARNAREQARHFASYAKALGVVLVAPTFAEARFPDYQRLGRRGRGARADDTLDAIVDEVAWLTGSHATRIHMFGYSGGAQFVHRYVMAHPQRVARAAVAAAGWYTFPHARTRFPYGTRSSRQLPGVRFDPGTFLRVPIVVIVGSEDTTSEALRTSERVNRQQGTTRVERAQNWVAAMRSAAGVYGLEPKVSLARIEGGAHSFEHLMRKGKLGEIVFEALFELPLASTAKGRSNGHG
jgi:poly(3-hydroxybutyrate) depolymerase